MDLVEGKLNVETRNNEEEGTRNDTQETMNWMRVADMIGSTLEEVCNLPELEKNELLGLLIITDEHKQEVPENRVYGENQYDNIILKVDEKRKDEARAKVIAELSRDVEKVKLQLTDIVGVYQASNEQTNKRTPSDEEIYAYLEAHLKDEERIQIVVDEFRGANISESQEQTVSHGHQSSQSSRPTLDVVEQMIQSVHEDDKIDEIPSDNLKGPNSNQERIVLSKRRYSYTEPSKPSSSGSAPPIESSAEYKTPSYGSQSVDEQPKLITSTGSRTQAPLNQQSAGPSTSSPSGPSMATPEKEQPSRSFEGPSITAPSQIEKSDESESDESAACAGGLAPQDVLPEGVEDVEPEALLQRDKEVCLIEMFPEYSPEWLLKQIKGLEMSWGRDDDKFNEHVVQIMEMDKINIPSRKEWVKQMNEREELDKWSGIVTVNNMLELYCGDPAKHFTDPNRKDVVNNSLYREHSLTGLLDAFRCTSEPVIDRELTRSQYNFSLAHKALEEMPTDLQTKRPNSEVIYPASPSIEFIKEKKFVELRKSIYFEKVKRDAKKRRALEAARLNNALVVCECCYNECFDKDMVPCNAGHLYCKECVGKSVNVAMGEGKAIILCLGQCEEEINTRELQITLLPNVLSTLLSRRQADEVRAAGIENLVTCPFCPYSIIMENEGDKVLVCRNPDCGRDSCRLCEQPSHIPFRCMEMKKNDIRKRVEEALSDAIIRKCANPKCNTPFMKTEGCNHMVCKKCGAEQCYICKKIVSASQHFSGQGGCPASQDNDVLHASEVSKAAQREAEELKKDGIELEYNPHEGIKLVETNK